MRWTIIPALMVSAPLAGADVPDLGGPMSHLLVSVFDQQVFVGFESPSMQRVDMQLSAPGAFDGPASVLNGTGYNAQFGWLANGFISLPPDAGVYVERVSSSPHLSVYGAQSFDPILGTDGSSDIWQWGGSMTHNWYATRMLGPHTVEYEVFVGDASGERLDGWTGGRVELSFLFGADPDERLKPAFDFEPGDPDGVVLGAGGLPGVPAPGAALPLALALLGAPRRRRAG